MITLNNLSGNYELQGNWSQGVTSTTITNGGNGWNSAPTVTITGGGGVNAKASCTVDPVTGAVTAVNIEDTGYNYTSAPTLTFGTAWQASTAYVIGDQVVNGGQIYTCDTAGTSAPSGGPSGTSDNIVDGTARWDHSGIVPTVTVTISGDFIIGYNFDMQVELPTLYRTFTESGGTRSDTRSDLIIHRVKI